jgi:glutaredoxin
MYVWCPHCEELLTTYQQESSEFAELTKRLTAAVCAGERDLVAQVWQQTREACRHCQAARELILLHFQTHKP